MPAKPISSSTATKRAENQAGAQRQALAGIMSQIGPEGPTPQQQAQINIYDPEAGREYARQAYQTRRDASASEDAKAAAAAKAATDEAAAVAAEQRVQARPQTEGAKITAAERQGQITPEQAAASVQTVFDDLKAQGSWPPK